MKNLIFGLIATVLFTGFSFGQEASLESKNSMEQTIKLVNVISLLEGKEIYLKSKSLDEFSRTILNGVEDEKLKEYFKPFIVESYNMNMKGLSQDQAYDRPNYNLYISNFNKMADYVKNNQPSTLKGFGKWFNLLRKIIDVIDDWINESRSTENESTDGGK